MDFEDVKAQLRQVKDASYALQMLDEQRIKVVLNDLAARLAVHADTILNANAGDLSRMERASPLYDRLMLDEKRIAAIAGDLVKVANLPSPVGQVIEHRVLPNGLDLSRVRVPLGVVGVIYEARPNVTLDVFALCFRTRNACVLRGGSDAQGTNEALIAVIRETLAAYGVDPMTAWLMPPDRALMPAMLTAHGLIDVIIPRGGQALIDHVRENATIPVIETGAGVVHIYFDASGDATIAAPIILNAKTRRPSVCNSLDTLLVHADRAGDLPVLTKGLAEKRVRLFTDKAAQEKLKNAYPSDLLEPVNDKSFDTEYMSLQMNVAIVPSADAAMAHIRRHSSGHTESIVTEDAAVAERFLASVDAAVVMVNASTAFSDGGEFGLGAEIGISTQKLHARGPMGLEPLTSMKWILRGRGQVR